MATEETPVPKENLDEKLGDLKLKEPEKEGESPPELHHVESPEPAAEPTEDGVVKAEVPEASQEELKSDHDIVPPAEEKSTTETKPAGGQTETPVEVTHENVDTKPPAEKSALGVKETLLVTPP